MTSLAFFKQVAQRLNFDYSEDSPYYHQFVKNNLVVGSLSIKDCFFDTVNVYDNIYYLITNKFIIREKFSTILLITTVEILNHEYSDGEDNPFKIINIMNEYSYYMKDGNINENVDFYAKSVKSKFEKIYNQIEENVLGKYIFLFKNDEKNKFELINNIEAAVSDDKSAQLASINLALKEI